MLEALVAVCLIATGVLAAETIVTPRRATELVAYALLFALTLIPFAAVTLALVTATRISLPMLAGVGGTATAALALAWWRTRGRRQPPRRDLADVALLLGAGLVAAGAALYYTDTEALLSLASYVSRGEAKCFYHLTFQLVDELNPGASFAPMQHLYDIISTPGNALFTAPFVPIFGVPAFRIIYVAVQVTIFLFVGLTILRWDGRAWVAAVAGLVAVGSPMALDIEVLDRNAIALALTAALFHTVETRPRTAVLHGWLFGVTAGTGLRFLPLLGGMFVASAYMAHRIRLRTWALFFVAAAVTFAFNVPHLTFHGFHSLGETRSSLDLLGMVAAAGYRTPLQPLPTGLMYVLQGLASLGAVGAGLVVVGAWSAWKTRRREVGVLLLMTLAVWAVLAVQRDWIEGDKARILLSAWLPVPLLLGLGLERLCSRSAWWRPAVLALAGAGVAIGLSAALHVIDAPVDTGARARKPVYQSDTSRYAAYYRDRYAPVGVLPGYGAIHDKLDLARKRGVEQATAATLAQIVDEQAPPDTDWVRAAFDEEATPRGEADSGEVLTIRIDLERLVSDPDNAVAPGDDTPVFVDLTRPERLLDTYHKEVRVSWQPEPLTVTALPLRNEVAELRELTIDLNAFASFGKDADGFERIDGIHLLRSAATRARAREAGLRALPQRDDEPRITLRVPADVRIRLVYWVIDVLKGGPFRVDSWVVGADRVEFRPTEPESYL